MAEIRCQMCGKPNPEHLEECQFCGARLKPLIASSGPKPDDSGSNWAEASPEDTLGWLRSLGQEEEQAGEPDLGQPNLDARDLEEDLPAWLGEAASPEKPASEWMDRGGQEDWSDSGTGSQFDQWFPLEEADSSLGSEGAGGLPAWLSNEEEEKTASLPGQPEEWTAGEEDWLKSIGQEDSLTATAADWKQPPSPSKPSTEALPNWLTTSPQDSTAPETDVFDDDLPSWLRARGATPASSEPAPTSSDAEVEGEFPDWLDTLSSKTGMTGKLGDMPQWIDESETDNLKEASFDWLATLGDTPETTEENWDQGFDAGSAAGKGAIGGLALDPEDSFMMEVGTDETPDWLQGLQDSAPGDLDAGKAYTGFQSTWGFDSSPKSEPRPITDTGQDQETLSPVEDSSVPGGLPSWIQAFRPMEGAHIAVEHTEGEVERVGPLAGLRDLLTPEVEIVKTSKPPSYSDMLQVSATQQSNTELLRSLVEAENIPQPLPGTSPLSSQRIMRIVFGTLLILLMLFPLTSGTEILPLPQTLPAEIQNLETLSIGAPLDRPILVAFDYEPGLSGELEAATRTLFDQWMDRGIPLALVSTSPLGTGLGERQVAYLQSKFPFQHTYVPGTNYVNLGYIAGGTAGLANFALLPRQTIRMAFDNRAIWELFNFNVSDPWLSPVMRPIAGLGDFYMTVLLTDNPETARNWIEQVEPVLRRNSLVIIASAQAEPFIRPYFQNPDPSQRQVEGLLVGLRGGAALEQNQGQRGPARLYWDAFGIGLLVAVILIIMGGGYNYLDELRRVQRQARRGKGKK